MTLVLTPRMLETAYEYLRATPPFRGWKLPSADEVEFRVTNVGTLYGYHIAARKGETPVIALSTKKIGHTASLMYVLAHEMVHFRLSLIRKQDKEIHGPNFQRLAARVCKHHGFDLKGF